MNMAVTREDDKPWKTDLARKSAQRREQVLQDVEEVIKKAPSFEEALRLCAEALKKRFARFNSVTIYVADGEGLAMHTALERPAGPEHVGSNGNPLADAAQGPTPSAVADLVGNAAWAGVGLTAGSVLVAPVRTEAGLWAIVEVWSSFRDAFTAQDQRFMEKVAAALGKKTPAA